MSTYFLTLLFYSINILIHQFFYSSFYHALFNLFLFFLSSRVPFIFCFILVQPYFNLILCSYFVTAPLCDLRQRALAAPSGGSMPSGASGGGPPSGPTAPTGGVRARASEHPPTVGPPMARMRPKDPANPLRYVTTAVNYNKS